MELSSKQPRTYRKWRWILTADENPCPGPDKKTPPLGSKSLVTLVEILDRDFKPKSNQ